MQGGYRTGAGRKPNTGKYKLPTKVMRVPIALEKEVLEFIKNKLKESYGKFE